MNTGSTTGSKGRRVDFYIWFYRLKVGLLILVPLLGGFGGTLLALRSDPGSFWQSIGVELSSATAFFILAMLLLPIARWRRKTFAFICVSASATCAFYASQKTGLTASWLVEASVGILMIVVLDFWISGVIQALRKDKEEYEKWDDQSKNVMNLFFAMPVVYLILAWKALTGEIKAPAEWVEEYEREKAQSRFTRKHVAALSLASVISLAFSVPFSNSRTQLDDVAILLITWALVTGLVLGQQGTQPVRLSIKLALAPSALLCLGSFAMAMMGWWPRSLWTVVIVFAVAFFTAWALLTLSTHFGSRAWNWMSNRVATIIKCAITLIAVVAVWLLSR